MSAPPSSLFIPNPAGGTSGHAALDALRDAGVTHVVTVPDFVQFALHRNLERSGDSISVIYAANEDQALTTAAGLWITGKRPVVLVQNQGLYKCANTLRAVCLDAGVPMVFLVGQFGREVENFGRPMTESRRSMVRFMEPFLDAFGIAHWTMEKECDASAIGAAVQHATERETAAVVLVTRHMTWN